MHFDDLLPFKAVIRGLLKFALLLELSNLTLQLRQSDTLRLACNFELLSKSRCRLNALLGQQLKVSQNLLVIDCLRMYLGKAQVKLVNELR